jgi:hypothetical protein
MVRALQVAALAKQEKRQPKKDAILAQYNKKDKKHFNKNIKRSGASK